MSLNMMSSCTNTIVFPTFKGRCKQHMELNVNFWSRNTEIVYSSKTSENNLYSVVLGC